MLVLKYTYQEERVELPFDLGVLPKVDVLDDLDKWDLLNFVASKVKGELIELGPNYEAAKKGTRGVKQDIGEVAYEFGFSSLVLLNANEPAVFIV